jgi:hypothetical protein
MDSGLFAKVLSSPEVIVASLALIFLLPLVFFIASTRSRRRFVRTVPRLAAPRAKGAAPAAARGAASAAAPSGAPAPARPPRRSEENDEEPEDLA